MKKMTFAEVERKIANSIIEMTDCKAFLCDLERDYVTGLLCYKEVEREVFRTFRGIVNQLMQFYGTQYVWDEVQNDTLIGLTQRVLSGMISEPEEDDDDYCEYPGDYEDDWYMKESYVDVSKLIKNCRKEDEDYE